MILRAWRSAKSARYLSYCAVTLVCDEKSFQAHNLVPLITKFAPHITMANKRKLTEVPEVTKASKLEISEAKKRAMTKNELMAKYNLLVAEHEELKKLQSENLRLIKNLEMTIMKIKKEEEDSIKKVNVDVQTNDSETCNECDFPANDIWEFGEHIYEFHTLKDHGDFACTFCNEKFGRKKDLMVHRKKDHIEKVNTCSFFFKGVVILERIAGIATEKRIWNWNLNAIFVMILSYVNKI